MFRKDKHQDNIDETISYDSLSEDEKETVDRSRKKIKGKSIVKRLLHEIRFLYSIEEPEEEHDEKKKVRVRDVDLPTGLREQVYKIYLLACVAALVTTVAMIVLKSLELAVGYFFAFCFLGLGYTTHKDYGAGKIDERVLLCTSIDRLTMRNQVRVVFRTQEEIPTYYSFVIAKKRGKLLLPNIVYIVYSRNNQLVAFQQL